MTDRQKKEIRIPVMGPEDMECPGTTTIKDEKNQSGQIEACQDQLMRLKAEFSNYKKRVEKERGKDFSTAKGSLAMNLLPVLDDFERMIEHHEEDGSCSLEGIRLIYQKMKKILFDEKLEHIPSVGHPFNPEYHEAVGIEETTESQDNIILEEWQKGYTFDGRLLRPGRVKVGKYVEIKSDS